LARGPETNIIRDDLPVDVLPVLSVDSMADRASPLNVHSDTLPQVCADCFCKFFPYLHSMPFRLRVPFSQAVFIRFIYGDQEVGDAAVFRLSYDGVSTKPTRHVDSIESASSREFAFPLCRAALRSDPQAAARLLPASVT
jgi:hypothetical protein